ncbi:MAG: hypothetical protein LKE53_09135 [Oscillospiraceae bacterium]|jgi:hypothetical protein|nr:hypothetical protein [Oscillospiraceae bacterium]
MLWAVNDRARLFAYDQGTLGCSIVSSAMAYGTSTAAARFWEGDGFILRKQDDTATLCGIVPRESVEELREFLYYIGIRNVMSTKENLRQMGLTPLGSGLEMRLKGDIPGVPLPAGAQMRLAGQVARPDALRLVDMYALLNACSNVNFVTPAFEPFYLDMSHRLRHGAALAAGIYRYNSLCACAAAALSPKQALLFAGAASLEERGNGLFAAVLSALAEKAAPRKIILLCDPRLRAHYEEMGFTVFGSCSKAHLS